MVTIVEELVEIVDLKVTVNRLFFPVCCIKNTIELKALLIDHNDIFLLLAMLVQIVKLDISPPQLV